DGVRAACDADLHVSYDPTQGASAIPRLTGDVTIDSFDYTRPVTMSANLASFGTRAKRTEVDAYDPTLDVMALDVRVRAAAPLVTKNHRGEARRGIDSGAPQATGTTQRGAPRAPRRALPGGRMPSHTNKSDVPPPATRSDDPPRIAPNVDITA